MSFGEPNNPYAAPQGDQQQPTSPGQGQPQSASHGYGPPPGSQQPAPGYGYPQHPGQGYPSAPQVDGWGAPATPAVMPGTVRAARVMLYVLGAMQAVIGLTMAVASAWIADAIDEAIMSDPTLAAQDAETLGDAGTGLMIVLGVLFLAFGVWAILTAARFGAGRGGIRVSAIVHTALTALVSLLTLLGGNIFALISMPLAVLIIVFCANRNGGLWFKRPRY
ncbi:MULTISPECIES: DUF3824 domain-containing protein [unclassified Streptomyces]|uniref:DUF3824 domain-containing protein n=1 Tax=unclassified Streptomyces TaxID=2593676 RepID=UPI0019056359|nr:DUF3824 domain-containing protein [Streptomyces sp. HSG2]